MAAATSSFVNYDQTAQDHRSLLVVVKHTGTALSSKVFNCAYEKISRINGIHVEGQKRDIVVNYRKSYNAEFNSWGDFQAHRKVLGLVSIGHCKDQVEFEELFASYKKIKGEYSSSIINSRFIVFGLNTDGTPICEVNQDNDSNESGFNECVNSCEDECVCVSENNVNSSSKLSYVKSEVESLAPLAEHEETSEPNSSKNLFGLSKSKSPVKRTQSLSRQHSNSLTKESSGAEIVFYPSLDKAADFEDRIKEFVTSLFYVLEGKRIDRSYERNERTTLLCAPFEVKDYVGLDTDTKSYRKKCMGRLRKHSGDLCLQASMPGEAILHYNTALDMLKSVNDFLWMAACLEGLCCASIILSLPKRQSLTGLRRNHSFQAKSGVENADMKSRGGGSSYANGLDSLGEMLSTSLILSQDDVIDKYKEAITFYSKFKNAAVIEMEASLKACRFLISHRRYLQASDFLQNVVYINLGSQEDDKIQRFDTLSSLYQQIGFKRKAAFFKRISGMHCTVPETATNWNLCYDLLLQSLDGYSLSVDPTQMSCAQAKGWPPLQYRVLHELVFAARKCGTPHVAVRNMSLLVHRMLPSLSVAEQREVLTGLSALTARSPGHPKSMALANGLILPPVSLHSLPRLKCLKLVPPSPDLRPHKLEGVSSDSSGVFIYTPLSLATSRTDHSRPDFKWVCGDVCQASLQLVNPLVDELKVTQMALLTSDLEAEVNPSAPLLLPEAKTSVVSLEVKPTKAGNLRVTGYTVEVFGVKSICHLQDIPLLKPAMTDIIIEVIPCLPRVSLTCSLPKPPTPSTTAATAAVAGAVAKGGSGGVGVVAKGAVVLFAGERLECVVSVENTSLIAVDSLRVWLETKKDSKDTMCRMVRWSEENIQSQLPLKPSSTLCFSLCIQGESHFLSPGLAGNCGPPLSQTSKSSFDCKDNRPLESSLCLEYSGGEGQAAGFCRKCCLDLSLTVLPSVLITGWDVQDIGSATQCRLCLDLLNMSGHKLTLDWGQGSPVSMGKNSTKRISIEVSRLEPDQVTMGDEDAEESRHIPSFYHSRLTPNPYSQCLGTGLDVQWTVPSTKASGKLCLDYIRWSPEQLSVLLRSRIHWDIQLNNEPFSSSIKPRFQLGQTVKISVCVETSPESWPGSSLLQVIVCQNEGERDQAVDPNQFAVLGSSVCQLEQVSTDDEPTISHSCWFSFFFPGSYYFKIFFSLPSSSSSLSSDSSALSPPAASPSLKTQPLPSSLSDPGEVRSQNSSHRTNESKSTRILQNGSNSRVPPTSISGSSQQDKSRTSCSTDANDKAFKPGWHFGSKVAFEIL